MDNRAFFLKMLIDQPPTQKAAAEAANLPQKPKKSKKAKAAK